MNIQKSRTLQEIQTTLSPSEALAAAKSFFAKRNSIYSAFPEQESESHLTLRGQGGEEIAIGVRSVDGKTAVTASSYMFDQQIARFFATLPTASNVPGISAPPIANGVAATNMVSEGGH